MPKRPSPKTTAYIPPDEECPDIDDACIERVVEDILQQTIGHTKLQHTTIISPVILELLDQGDNVLQRWEWDAEDWPCLSEFLADVRHRLSNLIDTQLRALELLPVEAFSQQVRDALFEQWGVEDISELRGPADTKGMAEAWLRDTVGLEGRIRPRVAVANIARTRLSRWSPLSEKRIVRQARALRELFRRF